MKSPAGTADDGPHVMLFGTRGGRAAVVLQWGTLGTEEREDIKRTQSRKGSSNCIPPTSNGICASSFSGPVPNFTESNGSNRQQSRENSPTQRRAGWSTHPACLGVLQQDDDESVLKAGCAHHASLLHTLRNEVGLQGAMGTLQIFGAQQETACHVSSHLLASLG